MKSLFITILLALAACSSTPAPPDRPPPPSAKAAWNEVRSRSNNRTSLRAEGRVTYFGEQGRVRVRAVVLASRPGSFRLETVSPFGQTLDVMVCNGEELALLSKDRLRRGPAVPENVARLVPLALFPREVVDTLLGGLPGAGRFNPTSVEATDDGHWRFAVAAADAQTATVVVDPSSHAVQSIELFGPDKTARAKVEFSDFEPVDQGGAFARTLRFSLTQPKTRIDIALKSPELNATLAPALFEIEAPAGIAVEPF